MNFFSLSTVEEAKLNIIWRTKIKSDTKRRKNMQLCPFDAKFHFRIYLLCENFCVQTKIAKHFVRFLIYFCFFYLFTSCRTFTSKMCNNSFCFWIVSKDSWDTLRTFFIQSKKGKCIVQLLTLSESQRVNNTKYPLRGKWKCRYFHWRSCVWGWPIDHFQFF